MNLKPYYQHAGITIYHGDSRELLPSVEFDVLVTDPPYGVDLGSGDERGGKHGMRHGAYASYIDSYENFVSLIVPTLNRAVERAQRAAVFTGPHVHEQAKPSVIGGVYCPSGQGRHGWGFKVFLPVLFYGKAPDLNLGARFPTAIHSQALPTLDSKKHPCPKPVEWMRWLVQLCSRVNEVIIDPFMGSGTTLVAAKDLGRRAVGIDIEERYCEVAAKRLSQEMLPLGAA